jgi:NADH dehydrogenase
VLPGLMLENCDVYDEAQLSERLRGKDVVVNLIGILNERWFGGSGFRRAHTELTRTLLLAARSANVGRLLQVSALGAAVDAPSMYLRSKGEAEKLIREQSALDWTIFQPSVMFGPGDTFLNRFARLLGAAPGVLPLARPNARFQPVFVDDVVDAILRCLRGGASSRQTYQLGGPQIFTLREVVQLVAKVTGRRRWIAGLPNALGRLEAAVCDFVPGRPFSSDNYKSLKVDSVCTEDGFERLKLKPHSMAASARQYVGALEDNARLSLDRAATGRS